MTSISNSLFLLPLQSVPLQVQIREARVWNLANRHACWLDSCRFRRTRWRSRWEFRVRVSVDSFDSEGDGRNTGNGARVELERSGMGSGALRGAIASLPPFISMMKRNTGSKFAISLYVAFALLAIIVRQIMLKKHSLRGHGSVADLVRRGQLRSDRRGISKPLKYEDPFNNPFMKIGKSNSTVEMCGKVYRLDPVTLTREQQSIHQKRRSRVYQWKRPTIFLKEGDSVPPDVDPDTVRWIPSNHPFATTTNDIDEDLAQSNVFQKHGVPSRVKAEHEALQRKLEALQSDQKLNNVAMNPKSFQDLERPAKSSKPDVQQEQSASADQHCGRTTSKPDPGSSEIDTFSDELRKF